MKKYRRLKHYWISPTGCKCLLGMYITIKRKCIDVSAQNTLSTSSHLLLTIMLVSWKLYKITLPYAYKWLNNQRQYRFNQFMFRFWNAFVCNNVQIYWLDNWMLNDCDKLKRCAHE